VFAAWTLVDGGVQLEEDLIAPIRQMQDQTTPRTTLGTPKSSIRKAKFRERSRASVEPPGGKAEYSGRIRDRTLELDGKSL